MKGYEVAQQVAVPLKYKEVILDAGFRIDLCFNQIVLVELKSIDAFASIHEAQVLTYLKLSGIELGLLINFNSVLLKDGIHRYVNNL